MREIEPLDLANFVIAVLALAAALASLVWQSVTWRRSGAIATARLEHGLQIDSTVLPMRDPDEAIKLNPHGLSDARCVVVLTVSSYPGRMPFTVTSLKFEYTTPYRKGFWQKVRLKRGTHLPFLPPIPDLGPALPLRIDTADEKYLAYLRSRFEYGADTWRKILSQKKIKIRAVVGIGNGKTIKTTAITIKTWKGTSSAP